MKAHRTQESASVKQITSFERRRGGGGEEEEEEEEEEQITSFERKYEIKLMTTNLKVEQEKKRKWSTKSSGAQCYESGAGKFKQKRIAEVEQIWVCLETLEHTA